MKNSILLAGLLATAATSVQALPVSLPERITHVKSPYELQAQTQDLMASQFNQTIFNGSNDAHQKTAEHAEFARFTLIDESYMRLSPMQSERTASSDLGVSVSPTQKAILGR